MDEIPYDPEKILFEGQEEPDVVSIRLNRPTQPGFRPQPSFQVPLNDLLAKVVRDHSQKSRLLFTYSRLEEGRVRLVVVRPGHFDDPLQLDILSVSLDVLPQYKALSYEWGGGPAIHPLILPDYVQRPREISDRKKRLQFLMFRAVGTRFFVRRNLFDALRYLRSTKQPVKLWIDAICINQLDDDEKAEQITRMCEIYSRAFNVNVWLGVASDTSDIAMDFIKELVQFQQLKAILHREESLSQWLALIDLMCSRWFSRRWVIQELALAKTASVHCGNKVVHWDDFADAISVFTTKLSVVRSEIQRSNKELNFKPEALSIVEALGARTLVRAKSNLLQKSNDGKILEKTSTLEYLVSTLVSFDASDPRDTIYALLSISRENPQRELRPNYKKSLLEVHTEFVKYCIDSSNTLDIICRHWAPVTTTLVVKRESSGQRRETERIRIETSLPSWISQLDQSAFGTPEKIFRGRKNADSLVGTQKVYNASGPFGVVLSTFGSKPSVTGTRGEVLLESFDGTLTVRGLVLGAINSLSPRMAPGKLPQEVLEMGGWCYSLQDDAHPVEKVPDALWRTLVANRDHNGQTPEPYYRRACLYSLQQEDASGDVDIADLMNKIDSPEEVVNFLKRVQEVVWNRKAFIGGKDNEMFGLCSKSARSGDLVCILYGCSVPVILREVKEIPKLGQRRVQNAALEAGTSSAGGNREAQAANSSSAAPVESIHPKEQAPSRATSRGRKPSTRRKSSSRKRKSNSTSKPSKRQRTNADGPLQAGNGREAFQPLSAQIEQPQLDVSRNPLTNSESSVQAVTSSDRVIRYKLIGECYVNGRMEGEAIDNESYSQSEQDFVLV
jgi:hypothetical protein